MKRNSSTSLRAISIAATPTMAIRTKAIMAKAIRAITATIKATRIMAREIRGKATGGRTIKETATEAIRANIGTTGTIRDEKANPNRNPAHRAGSFVCLPALIAGILLSD